MSNFRLFRYPPAEGGTKAGGADRVDESRRGVRLADRQTLSRVFGETRGYRLHVVGIFLLNLLATPLALLSPVPLAIAVDHVLRDDPLPSFLQNTLPSFVTSSDFRILLFAAGLSVTIVLLSQIQWLFTYLLETYTGEQLTLKFRAKLFRHVQRLSLAFHDSRGTADSIYRIQYDAPTIQWLLTGGVVPLVSSVTTLVAMIVVTAKLNWQLAAIAMVVAPLLYLSSKGYKQRMRSRYDEVRGIESSALGVIQEVLTAVRVVKAFGAEDREQDRFVRQSAAGMRARVRLAIAEATFGLMVNLIAAFGTAMVMFVGVRSVQSGALSLGALIVIMSYIAQLYSPLKALSQLVASVQSSLAGLRRAFELVDESPDVEDLPGARSVDRVRGEIEFKNVTFSYDGRTTVLDDMSFAMAAGARLGIAGRTGAGKTTLVNLLSRFYDPVSGQVLIDGHDIREIKVADLRNQFSIVLQDPVLFSTSIAENIAYARPDASQAEIEEAAKAANAHTFVSALPDGYETLVGERGMRLSGGERQRISLARAFLKDAPILVLDEPTSSVDIKTEGEIMEAMERLMLGRTTLMIAHRLSTLEYCDARIVVDHGKIVRSEGLTEEVVILP